MCVKSLAVIAAWLNSSQCNRFDVRMNRSARGLKGKAL